MGCRLEKWLRDWPAEYVAAIGWCACPYHRVYHTPSGDIPIKKERDENVTRHPGR